jgi:hypothetical protein
MKRQQAIEFILSVCSYLRLSQAKTLSQVVSAATTVSRVSLAEMGRALSYQNSIAAKHCIKRIDRFIGNQRVEPIEAMRGIVEWLSMSRKLLLVSIDWVDIRHFQCLVLAARLHGRAIPLLWAVYKYEDFYHSQNNLEYGLLRAFRTMLPKTSQAVILADRGFGRAEMARECQNLGLGYIIRIEPKVWIKAHGFTGKLSVLHISQGQHFVLHDVLYRKAKPVKQHIAVLWQTGQDKPWYLMTNLEKLRGKQLSVIFGRRMTIEEYFRDTKSKRNGFALRLTLIKDSQRLSRLLLILALAYILLSSIGLYCRERFRSGRWCSNNRQNECSFFTVGRAMLNTVLPSLHYLLRSLRNEMLLPNWG